MKVNMINKMLFLGLVLCIPHASYAKKIKVYCPPPKIPNINDLPSTLKLPPIKRFIFGDLIITPEVTTLSDIEKFVGFGKIQRRGDAGGSEYWVCYTSSLHAKPSRIWMSSGELGGSEHAVDIIYAKMEFEQPKKSTRCPELKTNINPISLGNSIWLGSNVSQLNKLFGLPSAKIGEWLFYSYSGKASIVGFDKLSILGVRITNGKVVSLYASQVTTN